MRDRFGQPWRFGDAVRRSVEEHASKLDALRVVRQMAVEGQEAKRELVMLKAGDMAGTIIKTFQDAMQRAMTDASTEIGGATDEMVATIKAGGQNVKRAIQAETMKVQAAFGVVVGNAADAAEDAVHDAKKLAEQGDGNG